MTTQLQPRQDLGVNKWEARAAVFLSICVLVLVAFFAPPVQQGHTDFLSFYAGAKLVGTSDLYSHRAVNSIQREYSNPKEVRAYTRPPYYAALLWPLGRLEYSTALKVWQAVNLLALVGFIVIWSRSVTAAISCCWYFPTWMNFAVAQDAPILLFLLACSAQLTINGRSMTGGLVFALCSIKFHLFLLAPLMIAAQKMWRFGAGLFAGGAALLALSFVAGGAYWPVRYLELLKANEASQDSYRYMPNLIGLFIGHGVTYGRLWTVALSIVIAILSWHTFRRASIAVSFALLPAAGLLVGLHSYLYDCMFLLPILIYLLSMEKNTSANIVSCTVIGLASLLLTVPSVSFVAQVLLVGIVVTFMIQRAGANGSKHA